MKHDDPPHTNDLELAGKIAAGDTVAFESFLEDLLPVLHRFAKRRLDSESAVQDVVQSTICKVIESLSSYRGQGSLKSWACGICRYEVFGVYRTKSGEPDQEEFIDESRNIQEALAVLREPETPHTELQRRQTISLVHLTLDQISDSYSSVLQMKYVEGLSVRAIAEANELSEKACESRLTRAREAFKTAFPKVSQGLLSVRNPAGRSK